MRKKIHDLEGQRPFKGPLKSDFRRSQGFIVQLGGEGAVQSRQLLNTFLKTIVLAKFHLK